MTTTKAINSKTNIKGSTGADLPFNPQQPVLNTYIGVSSAGQTSISLGFSIDTINNPHALVLTINGKTLTYGNGNDYIFGATDNTGLSSVVSLNGPIAGGLNIVGKKLGLRAEKELGIDNRFNQLYAMQQAGFQSFVDSVSNMLQPTATAGTPAAGTFYSSISNRAPITDLSQNLKAQMGLNRIMAPWAYQSQTEFGPNGEPVWLVENDIFSHMRVVGSNNAPIADNYGQRGLRLVGTGGYVEVTFYGTGLNVLALNDPSTKTYQYSVDGGSFTTFYSSAISTVFAGRSYSQNIVLPVVSGLTLGIHTVTLQITAGDALELYGIEILNSSANVLVNPGTSYVAGKALINPAQASFAYNSMVTGTAGGRVLVYQKADGTIGSAFTAASGSPLYLSSANHSNEEIVREYFPQEFGAGRSDDFSYNLSGANAAFTLDDGVTTLTGATVGYYDPNNGIFFGGGGAAISLTFVGTGLDIIQQDSVSGGANTDYLEVDGVTTTYYYTGSTSPRKVSLVSGLPYGTHSVRLYAGNTALGINKFIIYQPKTPSLPVGAVSLATYNVLANPSFPSNPTGAAGGFKMTGVLEKNTVFREAVYTGTTWSIAGLNPGAYDAGTSIYTPANGESMSYTFFGSGFSFIMCSGYSNANITVDGVALNASYPNASGITVGTWGYTSFGGGAANSSFLLSAATSNTVFGNSGVGVNSGFGCYGLTLDLHTVTITNSGSHLELGKFGIVTPIHSHKSLAPAGVQNVLTIGSQSIGDERKFNPVANQSNVKAWAQATGIVGTPTSNVNGWVRIPDMICTINTSGGPIKIEGTCVIQSQATSGVSYFTQLYVDGQPVGVPIQGNDYATGGIQQAYAQAIVHVSPGTHRVEMCWNAGGVTIGAYGGYRILTVEEK